MNTIQSDVSDIRIDTQVAEGLVEMVIAGMGDSSLQERIRRDAAFRTNVVRLGQDVVVVTTLAQTMAPNADFAIAVASRKFADGDGDLIRIGAGLLDEIAKSNRLRDEDIPQELVDKRFTEVRKAMVGGAVC